MTIYRIAVLSSHPVQYYAPLFRKLASLVDLHVFYAHKATSADQAKAGFGTAFEWDVDLESGYSHEFLTNVSAKPGVDHFLGCDTPSIGEILRNGCFDALLIMGWHLKAYLQGIVAAKLSNVPLLVRGDSQLQTPRSTLKSYTKEITYPFFLNLFDGILYVGRRSREYYENYGVKSDRLFFSPHCVDNEWFTARATVNERIGLRNEIGVNLQTPLVLFAGKLVEFKQPLDVIFGAARARATGLPLEILIAGDGPLNKEMRAAAQELRVPLHMLGFCNQTQMPAAYAAADCLVLPSDARETWGLVVNEALACGCAVAVSTACGCTPDLITDQQVGRSFTPGDIEGIADAMVTLVRSPPHKDAIRRVCRQYSLDAATEGIISAVRCVR